MCVSRTYGMGTILDNSQVISVSDFFDFWEIGWLTPKVHRHDGLGAFGNFFFNENRINIEGVFVDVYKFNICALV